MSNFWLIRNTFCFPWLKRHWTTPTAQSPWEKEEHCHNGPRVYRLSRQQNKERTFIQYLTHTWPNAWLQVLCHVCFYLHGQPDGWSFSSAGTESILVSEKFTEFTDALRNLMFLLRVSEKENTPPPPPPLPPPPPPHIWLFPQEQQNRTLFVIYCDSFDIIKKAGAFCC